MDNPGLLYFIGLKKNGIARGVFDRLPLMPQNPRRGMTAAFTPSAQTPESPAQARSSAELNHFYLFRF